MQSAKKNLGNLKKFQSENYLLQEISSFKHLRDVAFIFKDYPTGYPFFSVHSEHERVKKV